MQILNDRIALVTGGSRGIGASISKTLAENGAFVFVNYVNNKPAAERTVEEIRGHG
jgi:NAD(P)-dependent dehydrogenase (short-subunit alcohol dehydrogenase family)